MEFLKAQGLEGAEIKKTGKGIVGQCWPLWPLQSFSVYQIADHKDEIKYKDSKTWDKIMK